MLTPNLERSWVEQAQKGDKTAFGHLYRAYLPRVQRYANVRLGNYQDAEDVTSNTFFQVLRGIRGFEYRGPGSFTGWLFTIAYHEINKYLAMVGKRATIPLEMIPEPDDQGPPALDNLIHSERLSEISDDIDSLPPRRREIILLKTFAGLSNVQIAELLSLQPKSVAAELSRARADLQAPRPSRTPTTHDRNDRVFIAYGHDNEATQSVARFLREIRLNPILLPENATSQPICEQLDNLISASAFAVVLATPDDVAHERGKVGDERAQPRPNVFIELGFCMAKLGLDKISILRKDETSLPTDIGGIYYIPMDESGGWKLHLTQRLLRAGLRPKVEGML